MTVLALLRAALAAQNIEALLVSTPANRRYLSGFRGSNGLLLISQQAALIFTDFRYRAQVARECPAFTLHELGGGHTLSAAVAQVTAELGLTRLACEEQHLTVAQHRKLAIALSDPERRVQTTLEAAPTLVEDLREHKTEHELALLRQAIAITDEAFAAVLPQLTPEHSERAAAWLLEVALRERGAEAVSFPVIVAAGRNAALPHAQPGDDVLGSGQPIIIDMGARYHGYHADLTRTLVLGQPDARFWEVYGTVYAAQQRALANLRPGLTTSAADALARDFISEAGYGEAFGHGLGHGVGLDIHEKPSMGRRRNEDTPEALLAAGCIFSVEPGIYLPDWGGVRIEDLALLHEHGVEVLSQAPKLTPPA